MYVDHRGRQRMGYGRRVRARLVGMEFEDSPMANFRPAVPLRFGRRDWVRLAGMRCADRPRVGARPAVPLPNQSKGRTLCALDGSADRQWLNANS